MRAIISAIMTRTDSVPKWWGGNVLHRHKLITKLWKESVLWDKFIDLCLRPVDVPQTFLGAVKKSVARGRRRTGLQDTRPFVERKSYRVNAEILWENLSFSEWLSDRVFPFPNCIFQKQNKLSWNNTLMCEQGESATLKGESGWEEDVKRQQVDWICPNRNSWLDNSNHDFFIWDVKGADCLMLD